MMNKLFTILTAVFAVLMMIGIGRLLFMNSMGSTSLGVLFAMTAGLVIYAMASMPIKQGTETE